MGLLSGASHFGSFIWIYAIKILVSLSTKYLQTSEAITVNKTDIIPVVIEFTFLWFPVIEFTFLWLSYPISSLELFSTVLFSISLLNASFQPNLIVIKWGKLVSN